jgi:peptidyl-prolyl cis-trans isomerase A (cyclophilin A)
MQMSRFRSLACALAALAGSGASAAVTTTQVTFHTTLGNINVTLLPDSAPNTVANFLSYVNSGAYDHSFIHRSVPGFVIQGGGFFVGDDQFKTIPDKGLIAGEFKASNVRGTLAMALSTGPNTGSDQWFFNLIDNSATLDGTLENGPFTVFGQVSDSDGLAIMDAIAAQRTVDLSSSLGANFANVPVVNLSGTAAVEENNLVYVESVDALLAVGSPDYAIAASPAQLTLKAGTSGTSTLTVTPSNGYTGSVALSCGPLPTGVSCAFAPATLTFAAGATAAQISTLTVTTVVQTALNDVPASGSSGTMAGVGGAFGAGSGLAAIAGLFGLACIAVVARSRRGFALVFGAGFVAAAAGCGGTGASSPATQVGAFNVPIRLTDGSVSHPAALTITID